MELPGTKGEGLSSLINHPYFYHLALISLESVGPVTFFKCLDHFGKPENIFSSDAHTLGELGLKKKSIEQSQAFFKALKNALNQNDEQLNTNETFQRVRANILWGREARHHIIDAAHPDYPPQLKQIYDYPPLLFVRGNITVLKQSQMAVVGSRRPSRAGMNDAKSFSRELALHDLVVCSGLASGVDTFAHQGALEPGTGKTVAVLAHGLDSIYPRKNRGLAEQIEKEGGALVSEFPVGIAPKPEYFPRRNRIISGLSMGTLVVEAGLKSGTLITAYSALEQNREVFAIPGSIHNPVARGCHQLIRQGATLVESVDDILEELCLEEQGFDKKVIDKPTLEEGKTSKHSRQLALPIIEGLEEKVFSALDHDECSANELCNRLDLEIGELSSALTLLELKQLVIKGEKGFCKHPDL